MVVKAALLLFREHDGQRQLLFVRPHGKSFYVFPGGKQEPNETIEEALLRELKEELDAGATQVKKLGHVVGATPDGRPLHMHLYSANLTGEPAPHAEIAEIKWFSKDDVQAQRQTMTPMTLEHVLPFVARLKFW